MKRNAETPNSADTHKEADKSCLYVQKRNYATPDPASWPKSSDIKLANMACFSGLVHVMMVACLPVCIMSCRGKWNAEAACSGVLLAPDRGTKWLANAKANTNSDANNQGNEENLGGNFLAMVEPRHVGAAALNLGVLGLVLPVLLAWPNLALAVSSDGAAFAGCRLGDQAGFHICVKGVAVALRARSGEVDGKDADGGGSRECGRLFRQCDLYWPGFGAFVVVGHCVESVVWMW